MQMEKSQKYSESYIKGLELVNEELTKLKKEFDKKAEKKHENYIKKYHAELEQYDYDPEELHTAWGMDWISKYKYKSLLQLLESEPDKLLPEDGAVIYIEGLLINCEKDKCIAKKDDPGYREVASQESNRRRIDWSKHAEIYLKGLNLVYKKLQQLQGKFKLLAEKKYTTLMKEEYSALESYDYDMEQIHNAYGYEMIDLEEHDRLIKLLEQCEKKVVFPEDEAAEYFTKILENYEFEKQIAEEKVRQLKMR